MRTVSGAAVGLLVATAIVITGRPLEAGAIGGLNTVTVSPAHGKAAATFHVTYAITPCTGVASLTIGFSWGALAPGGPVLGTAATDSGCRATLTATPPANPAAGTYQVFGYVALPTGAPTPGTDASASYTVDVTPAPTPTPSASASASASATARTSASARPTASASGSTAASSSASASTPAASNQPVSTAAGQPSAGTSTGFPSGSSRGWWILLWPILLAAAVLFAAIAILAAAVLRKRRDAAAAKPGKEKAA